jgi:hypothetical protein
MRLLLGSTPTALWQGIIHEAEMQCTIKLREEIESYLVFLLMRYMDKPQLLHHIMATEFMGALQENRRKQQILFQEVGDKCLLFSGLFPQIAEKRFVKISYFVEMGQSAYFTLSKKSNDLYGMLSKQFVPLMDILQSIRSSENFTDLMPLEAYELWNDTGSQRAFYRLKTYTQAIPKKID